MPKIVQKIAQLVRADRANEKKMKKDLRIPKSSKQEQRQQKLAAPVAIANRQRTSEPKFRFSKGGNPFTSRTTTLIHKEYVTQITSPSTSAWTVVNNISINPGNSAMFQWLNSLAGNWETFRFTKLKFIYDPFVATSTAGMVAMGVDYDATDTAPATKQEFLNLATAASGSTWAPLSITCSPSYLNKAYHERYVNTGSLASNTDAKTVNVGQFFVAIQALATSVAIGDLWVEYTVELSVPQFKPSLALANAAVHFTGSFNTGTTTTTVSAGVYNLCSTLMNTTTSGNTPNILWDYVGTTAQTGASKFLDANPNWLTTAAGTGLIVPKGTFQVTLFAEHGSSGAVLLSAPAFSSGLGAGCTAINTGSGSFYAASFAYAYASYIIYNNGSSTTTNTFTPTFTASTTTASGTNFTTIVYMTIGGRGPSLNTNLDLKSDDRELSWEILAKKLLARESPAVGHTSGPQQDRRMLSVCTDTHFTDTGEEAKYDANQRRIPPPCASDYSDTRSSELSDLSLISRPSSASALGKVMTFESLLASQKQLLEGLQSKR